MLVNNISDFVLGWVVGDFTPSVVKTDKCEIAVKSFCKGDVEPCHIHTQATEIIVVLEGKISVKDKILESGNIISVEPLEETDLKVLEDAKCLFVKTAGKNDRVWTEKKITKKYNEWSEFDIDFLKKTRNKKRAKVQIYIVTYKRNDILNQNLKSLWDSLEDENGVEVTILANHPDIIIAPENQRNNLRIIPNYVRSTGAWGNLAKDWNYAIIDCFKDCFNPQQIDWCILAQNDVEWLPGWQSFLKKTTEFDMITQPCGDQLITLNIDAVKKVGFFDERFSTLHFHEQDYFTRAIHLLGKRVSINDGHRKNGASDYQSLGNVFIKPSMNFINYAQPEYHHYRSMSMLGKLLKDKYHLKSANDIFDRERVQQYLQENKILATEINWYPFFWEGYKEIEQTFLYND